MSNNRRIVVFRNEHKRRFVVDIQQIISSCYDLSWTIRCAELVNEYFKRPYKDKVYYTEIEINHRIMRVNRPNHALAHGLRQGLLTLRCIEYFSMRILSVNREFRAWLIKMMRDPNFFRKVQLAASYMRTGRQSEVSSSENPSLYKRYERSDVRNFLADTVFDNVQEQYEYARAITWKGDYPLSLCSSTTSDYLRTIFHIAHRLDLRRIIPFSEKIIKDEIADSLSSIFPDKEYISNFVDDMWQISGKYLRVTGDKDLVIGKDYYSKKFYLQAHNYVSMAKALHSI